MAPSDNDAMNPSAPTRREALRRLAAGVVGAAGTPIWVQSLTALARTHADTDRAEAALAAQEWTPAVFTARQNEAVIALTELIIPATDTPGAKATLVNRFIDRVRQHHNALEREQPLETTAPAGLPAAQRFSESLASLRAVPKSGA